MFAAVSYTMEESEKLMLRELTFYINGKKVCWSVIVFVVEVGHCLRCFDTSCAKRAIHL